MFKSILKYLPSVIIPTIFTIINTFIYGNYMEVEEYGQFNLLIITISLVYTIIFSFQNFSILRLFNSFKLKEQNRLLLSSSVNLSILGGLTLYFLILPFKSLENKEVIILSIVSLSLFNIYLNYFRAGEKIKFYNFLSISFPVGTCFLLILFHKYFILNSSTALLAMYIPLMCMSLGLTLLLYYKKILSAKIDKTIITTTFKYGFPLAMSGILFLIMSSSDRYIIKIFMTNKEVGLYSFSYKISELSLTNVTMAIMLALYPFLIKIYDSSDIKIVEQTMSKYLSFHIIVMLPLVTIIFIYTQDLLYYIFPSYYEGANLVKLVTLGTLIFTFSAYTDKAFQLSQRTTILFRILLVSAVSNLLFNFLLIPFFDLTGAVIATILAYLIYIIMSLKYSKSIFKFSINLMLLWPIFLTNFLIIIFMKFLYRTIHSSSIVYIIIQITIYILLYSSSLLIIKYFRKE